jgi:hypothetical protein
LAVDAVRCVDVSAMRRRGLSTESFATATREAGGTGVTGGGTPVAPADCQAFAHHLHRPELLDTQGGSLIIQLAPAYH